MPGILTIKVLSIRSRPIRLSLAARLGGIKLKKSSLRSAMNNTFLLFSFPRASELNMNFDLSKVVYFNVCFCNVEVYFHP